LKAPYVKTAKPTAGFCFSLFGGIKVEGVIDVRSLDRPGVIALMNQSATPKEAVPQIEIRGAQSPILSKGRG
jgi:hypothetical protein